MTSINYSGPAAYYRHSGRFNPLGAVAAVGVGAVAAVLIGAAYAYLDLYIPIAGWVTFLLTGGSGFLLGGIVGQLLKAGKMRNTPLAMVIALFTAVILLGAAWLFWLYAFLHRVNKPVTLSGLIADPVEAWNWILAINHVGAWKLRSSTPTGLFLWALWAIEAGALLGIPVWLVHSMITGTPFCETCGKWGVTRELVNINAGDAVGLRTELERKNFAVLTARGKAPPGSGSFYRVFLQGCSACDSTQTLCVEEVTITVKKNETKTKKKMIVNRLRLTPEETVGVATAVAMLNAPPAAEEDAAKA